MTSKFLNTEVLMEAGNEMLKLIAKKLDEISNLQHPVVPKVEPGFLRRSIPDKPPQDPEDILQILKDTEEKIFPGLTLWSHPNFFAYYPMNICHASIISEMFAQAFCSPGFQWIASPSQTELENIVCDWMVDAMQLPEKFYLKNSGGGTIANTVSDAIFISIHAAKRRKMKELNIDLQDARILKFSAYFAENVHASTIKGLLIKDIYHTRKLPVEYDPKTQNFQIDLEKFKEILQEDINNGLIPFWAQGAWGTTGTCSYDQLYEIGQICQKNKIWFNVDAAYAGSSWVIPRYREKAVGLEFADSVQINFAKLMQVGLSGTLFYVGDKSQLFESMGNNIEFGLYKNKFSEFSDVMDYKDWQVALGRKFNSLKMWWMIRSLGIKGMQEQVEQKIELTLYLENLIKQSPKFKLFTKSELTLVTFIFHNEDLNKQNELNKSLQAKINEDTRLGYITGTEIKGIYYLRAAIANNNTTQESIRQFWEKVLQIAETHE